MTSVVDCDGTVDDARAQWTKWMAEEDPDVSFDCQIDLIMTRRTNKNIRIEAMLRSLTELPVEEVAACINEMDPMVTAKMRGIVVAIVMERK